MGLSQQKGNLGLAIIMAEVMRRGYKVALPLGEDWPFDLIVLRQNRPERVQCKYTESNGECIKVQCRSASEWVTYKYTAEMIDWIAVYDKTIDKCFFVPLSLLGTGRSLSNLRLTPAQNEQIKGVRKAEDFVSF